MQATDFFQHIIWRGLPILCSDFFQDITWRRSPRALLRFLPAHHVKGVSPRSAQISSSTSCEGGLPALCSDVFQYIMWRGSPRALVSFTEVKLILFHLEHFKSIVLRWHIVLLTPERKLWQKTLKKASLSPGILVESSGLVLRFLTWNAYTADVLTIRLRTANIVAPSLLRPLRIEKAVVMVKKE